ncbi:class II aldolase/adducin family protein [Dehalococcoidia bacterium]|nr:class II aldolase/adducin family protein [Dehalococcoidia bacterium]
MNERDIRFKIAASRRMLHREGCDSTVGGHVSSRAADGSTFWISPFEYFDETTPDRVVRLDMDLHPLDGEWEPSPAASFHAALYQGRPDIGSVIHTHSKYTSLFVTRRDIVGQYNVASVLFWDEQVLFEDDGLKPPVYGPDMVEALGPDRTVLLVKNHGAIIVGDTLENATIKAMVLETACWYHLEAEKIGGTEFPEPEVIRGKAAYEKYYLPNMWKANFRRLRRSDPDLFEWLDDPKTTKDAITSLREASMS